VIAGRGAAGCAATALGLVLAALVPRLGPALTTYQPSNDAAEHLLIARSLARGDGFTMPIRVRDVSGGPAVHEAFADRAPLYPALLSVPVRLGFGAQGWPDPRLQLLGAVLAALCAPLAACLSAELCRRHGLDGWSRLWAIVGAGLVVAWCPSLVRASIHLWAEPLGLLLVLAAARLDLALDDDRRRWRLAALVGVIGGLARFARPEAWVLVLLLLARAVWRARGAPEKRLDALALVVALVLVNVAGVATTGVVAPQLFLLEVGHYEDAMGVGAAPIAPTLATVISAVVANLGDQLGYLVLPKNAWLVLPLAAVALLRPGGRSPLHAWAIAFVLATAGVWSTNDPQRFTIAPLALLAPVALIEAELWRRDLVPGRRLPCALLAGSLVLVLGYAAGRELRGRGPEPPPVVVAQEGVPALADPWSYALVTGRSATLARQR
jgi:hypothetical protein